MSLIDKLYSQAIDRKLLEPGEAIELEIAYRLVRDMPYRRASDRQPETLICEWRGTCSGKHYLLRALFAELGYHSQVMACTSVELIDEEKIPPELFDLWDEAGGRFVDVHNYLMLDYPGGQMIVDATWPVSTGKYGLPVNDEFTLGKDQHIACAPLQTWIVPNDHDPQDFKEELLRQYFTQKELAFREAFIHALGAWFSAEDGSS